MPETGVDIPAQLHIHCLQADNKHKQWQTFSPNDRWNPIARHQQTYFTYKIGIIVNSKRLLLVTIFIFEVTLV